MPAKPIIFREDAQAKLLASAYDGVHDCRLARGKTCKGQEPADLM